MDSNTDKVYARVIDGSRGDTEAAIIAASEAFPAWSRTPLHERKAYLIRILEEFQKRKVDVGTALTHELGAPKPFAENVQAAMFPAHFKTAIELADSFEWTKDMGSTTIRKETQLRFHPECH